MKYINSTKECVFSGEHAPYNLSREEGASGTENSTYQQIDVYSSPTAGLVLLSTTVFCLFVAGGCWAVLCVYRPDLIQSLGLFLTGGLTVSKICIFSMLLGIDSISMCCQNSKNTYRWENILYCEPYNIITERSVLLEFYKIFFCKTWNTPHMNIS